MKRINKLKVAINCLGIPNQAGGIKQYVIGLIHGLKQVKSSEIEYLLVTKPQDISEIESYTGSNMRIISLPSSWKDLLRTSLRAIYSLPVPIINKLHSQRFTLSLLFEALNVDVVHFPTQRNLYTTAPSVYNPHDLQHLHYPEFFSKEEIREREKAYRAGCNNAQAVVVGSLWIKEDLVRQYEINPQKIYVIPSAPPTEAYDSHSEEMLDHTKDKFKLPPKFAFYPAHTWPHKNHIRLLEAIALMRKNHEVKLNLVCTGTKKPYWSKIKNRVNELQLQDQFQFLGFVSTEELRALYQLSLFTVIPTLFEEDSLPLFEAWREGSPVACSCVTSLPYIAGNAALLFDPTSVKEISEVLYQMTTDAELRRTLKKRGKKRIKTFSWKKTARMYVTLYKKIAEKKLTQKEEGQLREALKKMGGS